MNAFNFLAFDLGATSGRAILFTTDSVNIDMKEIYRFPNAIMELHGKYYWNIYQLYEHLKKALQLCSQKQVKIDSIGIDTWGVDFGYIAADGTLLGLPRSYRDPYTQGSVHEFFKTIKAKDLYAKTGIQIMPINSLFQLFSAKKENFAPLEQAEEILFMPDLLSYLLTGNRICEYTIASTSQLLNQTTKQADEELLQASEVKPSLIRKVVEPGTTIGVLTKALADELKLPQIPVVAVAGHDTASAVLAVPAQNKNFAYLSSGTWSLMGIETEEPLLTEASFDTNFTNEGGVEGTIRFLKNITGMWLLEQCKKEWSKENIEYSYSEIEEMAQKASSFTSLINPDDPRFANPIDMVKEIKTYCEETNQPVPQSHAEIIRCIFISLAQRYKETLALLQKMAPFPIERLYVIGGGSQNDLLNQLTANALGIPVMAGPSEATAIGNAMMQAKAKGLFSDRWEIRARIAQTYKIKEFTPNTNG